MGIQRPNISGNAGTATKLQTARQIGGVNFDGTANITLPGVNATGNQNTTGSAAQLGGIPAANYARTDGTGAAGTWGISITGGAAYATSAGSAGAASGSSFFVNGGAGEGSIGAYKNGRDSAYIYNNDTSWGVYSPTGGLAFAFNRALSEMRFHGVANSADAVSKAGAQAAIAQSQAGDIGTYAFLYPTTAITLGPGGEMDGVNLRYGPNSAGSSAPPGRWRLMANLSGSTAAAVWLRIS